MDIVGPRTRNGQREEVVHTELVGGRLGIVYRASMPLIKVSLTRQGIILRLAFVPQVMRLRKYLTPFVREFRIPRDKILYVQTQRRLIRSELKIVHAQPDAPAAISIISLKPTRLMHLFSSLGIRVDDRAGLATKPGFNHIIMYVQVVGSLLLVVAGTACLVALTVWAMKTLIVREI